LSEARDSGHERDEQRADCNRSSKQGGSPVGHVVYLSVVFPAEVYQIVSMRKASCLFPSCLGPVHSV
jgi:hypothetical protein